jgi:hypothetical protein
MSLRHSPAASGDGGGADWLNTSMSKHETPMTRWYWSQVGGTLVEEFALARRSSTSSARWADGLVLPDGPRCIAKAEDVDVDGQEVIIVQAKVGRLRMTLMGQVVFSQKLMYLNYEPKRVRSVALCEQDDDVLRPMLEAYEDIEVVIAPQNIP